MVYDHLHNWRQYFSGPAWKTGFSFLDSLAPDAEEGYTYLQDKEIFGRVMSYPTKTPAEAIVEAHREYIDIQMTLANAEGLNWYATPGLEPKLEYDAVKDRTLYHPPPGPALGHVDVLPRMFAVLFPEDAHMPQLIVGESSQVVRKAVVKIRVDLVVS